MPIYAYRCATCGHAKDVLRKMSDPILTVCPSCGASTFEKQVTAAGFQLKGSGWYVTDFRGDNKAPAKSGDDSKAADSGSSAEGGSSDAAKSDTSKAEAAKSGASESKSEPAASPGKSGKSETPAPSPAATPAASPPASGSK